MDRLILSTFYKLRLTYRRIFNPLTLGVRCIVVREDGHVLLVRHTYLPGWYLPGGGVERSESLEEAITRELREEVGVTPRERPSLFYVYSNFLEHKSDHVVVFVVRRFEMESAPNLEIAEHGFFDPAAPPEAISGATLRRLDEWRGHTQPDALW